jgi:hypothetical protein
VKGQGNGYGLWNDEDSDASDEPTESGVIERDVRKDEVVRQDSRVDPAWRMPELLSVDFGREIWRTKSREFAIEKLFGKLRRNESWGTDDGSVFM